jgi:hypothetical protein
MLAYQFVQFLRTQLKARGIHDSWTSLRALFGVQRRVSAAFRQGDGRTLNVRKATLAEPDLQRLYEALGIDPAPGGTRKLVAGSPDHPRPPAYAGVVPLALLPS